MWRKQRSQTATNLNSDFDAFKCYSALANRLIMRRINSKSPNTCTEWQFIQWCSVNAGGQLKSHKWEVHVFRCCRKPGRQPPFSNVEATPDLAVERNGFVRLPVLYLETTRCVTNG